MGNNKVESFLRHSTCNVLKSLCISLYRIPWQSYRLHTERRLPYVITPATRHR